MSAQPSESATVEAVEHPTEVRDRRMALASAFIALIPLWTAAIRAGHDHWEPTWDAATTVARVRDVFSAHPPLYGLVASSSASADPYSYLGATQFYLLAVPVRLFGSAWGTPLGMAAIQSVALLAALWLVHRRIGSRGAILASAIVASLLLTLGSEFIIDPTPVQAVTLPFFTFLVAAWSVACDDGPAILILAAVGNYLVLTHPAMALVTPMTAAVASICWIAGLRSTRRSDPEGWPRRRRNRVRWLGAGIITAVALWTPPLYEQFTAPRGNLGMFVHGALSPSTPHVSASLGPGVAAIVSVIAVPPFWLPPHFSHIPFDATGGGQPFWVRVASTVMLVIAGFLALRWAHRHDRPAVPRALVIAVGAVGGWLVTWRSNPNVGLPIKYFWGLWPLAAFIWLVLAYTAACAIMARFSDTDRLRPNGVRNLTIAVGCATVVATSLLAVPRRNLCRGVCASSVDPLVPVARDIRKVVAHDLRGRQAVLVPSSLGITDMTAAVQPSLVLGLQDAAVPAVASTPFDARQFAIPLESAARPAATVRLDITHTPLAAPNAKLLGVFSTRPDISPARFAHLDAVVSKWLRHGPSTLEIASRQVRLGESDRVYWFLALGFRASATEDPSSQPLANFIAQLGLVGLQPRSGLLDVPGLSRADVQEWANERARKSVGTFYLYVVPVP